MKTVVHISTSDQWGGAAISAWRLHKGMQELGIDSRVVCRHTSSTTCDVSSVTNPLFELLDLLNRELVAPAQPDGATLFSLAPLSLSLMNHPWIAAADVIHLHWVAQFIAPEDIAELCKAGKTVFWTFHDQWPYTGGCHYIGGSTRNENDWDGSAQIGHSIQSLAKKELERKKQAFRDLPIQVIAPSRWMAEEAVASGVFREAQIHVIPYGINTSVFYPSRHVEDLTQPDQRKVILLFGCQCVGDARKGYKEFCEALSYCLLDNRFVVMMNDGLIEIQTFGELPKNNINPPFPVTHLGMLIGELKVANLLRASSAFICPTLEDNLPNVVLESLVCGCPVIAFKTGGIPDMVSHEQNGLLARVGDSEELSKHLINFCLDGALRQRLRETTRQTILENYSLKNQATKIRNLYDTVGTSPLRTNHPIMPDCPLPIPIEAKVLPHFGTELALMLLEVKRKLEIKCYDSSQELSLQVSDAKLKHLLSEENTMLVRQQLLEAERKLQEKVSETDFIILQFEQRLFQKDLEEKLLMSQAENKLANQSTENDFTKLRLHQAHNELKAYFSDNRNLVKYNNKLEKFREGDQIKLGNERKRAAAATLKTQQIKQQLSYRLGSTIVVHCRSLGGLISLPFLLIQEIKQHRILIRKQKLKDKKPNQKNCFLENAIQKNNFESNSNAVERVKQQLSYRIGNACVRNARFPIGWIKMPYSIFREIVVFNKRKAKVKNKR